jgi:hypothetical protein
MSLLNKIDLIKYLTDNIIKENDQIKKIFDNLSNDEKKLFYNSYILKHIVNEIDKSTEEIYNECVLEEIKLRYPNNINLMTSLLYKLIKTIKYNTI